MEVLITTAPASDEELAQCPTCSRMYRLVDNEGHPKRPPEHCLRCDSPMDVEASKEFREAMAERSAQFARPAKRPTRSITGE